LRNEEPRITACGVMIAEAVSHPESGYSFDGKRLSNDWLFNHAAPQQTDRHAAADDLPVLEDPHLLEVLLEATLRDPGRLAPVAAQVFRLAPILDRATECRLVIAVGGDLAGTLDALVFLESTHQITSSGLSPGIEEWRVDPSPVRECTGSPHP